MPSRVNLAETSVSILRTWFNFLPGMAYRCNNDHDWTMQIVSAGSFELTGYTPLDFLERKTTFDALILPEFRELVWSVIQKAVIEKTHFTVEYKIRTKTGDVKWVWEKGTGIYDNEGSLLFLEGYIADVSDRKEKEIELDSFFDIQPELLCISTLDGVFLKLNRSWEKKFGYPLEELIGTSFKKLIHPDDLERTSVRDYVTTEGIVPSFRNRYITKDGRVVHLEWSAALRDGKFYASARDITENMESINRLEKATEELKELNDLKNKFISILAHDLRGPFHPLLSSLELLDLDYDRMTESERKHFIRSGRETTVQLFEFLESILSWSKVSQGKISLNLQRLDVNEAISRAVNQLSTVRDSKRITVEMQGEEPVSALADLEMLVTILRNILSNSIKFSDPGSTVEISTFSDDDSTTITIRDYGQGIEQAKLDTIFEITKTRSTRGTSNEPGSGMGLIICNEIVTKMNGKIAFSSKPGSGTTVTISLPKA